VEIIEKPSDLEHLSSLQLDHLRFPDDVIHLLSSSLPGTRIVHTDPPSLSSPSHPALERLSSITCWNFPPLVRMLVELVKPLDAHPQRV